MIDIELKTIEWRRANRPKWYQRNLKIGKETIETQRSRIKWLKDPRVEAKPGILVAENV